MRESDPSPRRSELTPAGSPARGALLALLLSASASAQGLHVETLTPLDGMPGGLVGSMAQTEDGRLWFAARNQLSSWDGTVWTHLTAGVDLEPEMSAHWIAARGMDVVCSSWRLRDGLLLHEEAGGWEELSLETITDEELDLPLGGLEFVGDDRVVLALGEELLHLDLETRQWTRIAPPSGAAGEIRQLELAGDELLLTRGRSIERLPAGTLELELVHDLTGDRMDPLAIHAAPPGPSGRSRLWVAGRDSLGYYEDGRLYRLPVTLPGVWQEDPTLVWLEADRQGNLFLTTRSTVLLLDGNTGQIRMLDREHGLAGLGATSTFSCRDGNVWICSQRGLTRIPPQRFMSWTARHGLPEDEVTAVEPLGDGRMVLGHHGALTIVHPDRSLSSQAIVPMGSSPGAMTRILELEADGEGGMWIAAAGSGLFHMDRELTVRAVPLEAPFCNSVSQSPGGGLAVGTDIGVFLSTAETPEVLSPLGELISVRRVEHLSDGTLLASLADEGLCTLEPGATEWKHLEDLEERNHRNLFDIHEDASGRVLVGSNQGLLELRDGRLRPASEVLDSDLPVYSILEESPDVHWFGTSSGVFRTHEGTHEQLHLTSGLVGSEANRDALYRDAEGRIWIGTDGGLSIHIGPHRVPPRPLEVELTSFERGPVSHGEPTNRRDLEAHFRVVTFGADRRVNYRAKLEGYDADWLPERPLKDGLLRYTNLPKGEYRLALQARPPEGSWGPVTYSEPLSISPPLFERPWFQGVLGVLGALAFSASVGLVRFRRRSQDLEVEVDRSQEALEQSEIRYREIFQNNPAILLMLDPNTGQVLEANGAAVSYFGNSLEELRELDLAELTGVGFEDLKAGLRTLADNHEWICRPGDEDPLYGVPIEIRASEFVLQGEPIVQATIYDIEQRQRLEQQLLEASRLRAVGELARGVAHDFNNLLTAILGHNELVDLDSEGNALIASHTGNIREAGERGAQLVQQLLAFARKHEVHIEELDLNALMRNAVPLLESALGSRYQVQLDLGHAVDRVHADRNQLQRILMNMALSARDEMPGGGTVLVRSRHIDELALPDHSELLDPSHAYASVTVMDMPGPSSAPAPRIPRGASEETELSNALLRDLIETCGGYMAPSQSLEGRTVHSAYFVAVDSRPALEVAGRSGDGGDAVEEDLTVFLVEDNEPVRITIAALLRSCGHRVLQAETLNQARTLFSEHAEDIDLVLTDLQLPDGNGKDLAREIRERCSDMRVVFMSGAYDEALGRDGETFIHKPFNLAKLSRALARPEHS